MMRFAEPHDRDSALPRRLCNDRASAETRDYPGTYAPSRAVIAQIEFAAAQNLRNKLP
jgi:hypothetical protein